MMSKALTLELLIDYLQAKMDDFKDCEAKWGEDRITIKKLDSLIACKEMVEAIIRLPVNLQKDGKVTIGY